MKITVQKINDKTAQADISVKVNANTPAFKSRAPLFLLAKLAGKEVIGLGDAIELV